MNFRRVLMCRPSFFKVQYKINPWMSDDPVDAKRAMQQWETLKKTIEQCGVEVKELTPVNGLPDMVFCCNAGIVHGNKVYLSHFRHPERQGERDHYEAWFKKQKFEIFGDTLTHFEGGGDATFTSTTRLWGAYGYRSERQVYDKIAAKFKVPHLRAIVCQLASPQYYHIDTCFCPLSETSALWFPPAFTEESQKQMKEEKDFELIPVSKADAEKFVCNSITIGKTVISPVGCDETTAVLERKGFTVAPVDLSEFMKSGGACQCLVLKL